MAPHFAVGIDWAEGGQVGAAVAGQSWQDTRSAEAAGTAAAEIRFAVAVGIPSAAAAGTLVAEAAAAAGIQAHPDIR